MRQLLGTFRAVDIVVVDFIVEQSGGVVVVVVVVVVVIVIIIGRVVGVIVVFVVVVVSAMNCFVTFFNDFWICFSIVMATAKGFVDFEALRVIE